MSFNPNIFGPDSARSDAATTPPTPQLAPEGLSYTVGFDLGKPGEMTSVTVVIIDGKQFECPKSVLSAPLDIDGNPIMPMWASNDETIRRYNLQPAAWRARRSREWMQAEIEKAMEPEKRKGGNPGKKFSTQYCVDWGKTQKKASGLSWSVIDRENWQPSYKKEIQARSYDLMLGLDVLFDDGNPGMVGMQAGTAGEEKAHARTFLERGGPEKAKQRFVRVFWIAFERGNHTPVEGPTEWTLEYLQRRFPDLFGPAKLLIF